MRMSGKFSRLERENELVNLVLCRDSRRHLGLQSLVNSLLDSTVCEVPGLSKKKLEPNERMG